MNTYVIYHSADFDGMCSAAILKLKYPEAIVLGYNYGEPLLDIPDGQIVFMVDVSYELKEIYKLAERSHEFTWIDHHISKITEYEACLSDGGSKLNTFLKNGTAACELTWLYLFKEAVPKAVLLLSHYDTWRHNSEFDWEAEILPFQYGLRHSCNNVSDVFKNIIHLPKREQELKVLSTITIGKIVLHYQDQVNAKSCTSAAFTDNFDGLPAVIINDGNFSSNLFKSVYSEGIHKIMICFRYSGKGFWVVSFYTTHPEVDCSKIAKSLGGGGHKQAAGCQVHGDILEFFKSHSNA